MRGVHGKGGRTTNTPPPPPFHVLNPSGPDPSLGTSEGVQLVETGDAKQRVSDKRRRTRYAEHPHHSEGLVAE